jgi:hypothetical protein
MPETPEEIMATFRSGGVSAEDAAQRLLPLLQAAGTLTLDVGPDTIPVLEALKRLAHPPAPPPRTPTQPLIWESPHWRDLARVPEGLWRVITERRLDQSPRSLRYVFTVGSDAAARILQQWIAVHSDHQVTPDLPASFEESRGQIVGLTRPALLTRAGVAAWVAWLQSMPSVPDAALTDLGISDPPPAAA